MSWVLVLFCSCFSFSFVILCCIMFWYGDRLAVVHLPARGFLLGFCLCRRKTCLLPGQWATVGWISPPSIKGYLIELDVRSIFIVHFMHNLDFYLYLALALAIDLFRSKPLLFFGSRKFTAVSVSVI